MNKKEIFIQKIDIKYGVGKYSVLGEYKDNKTKILIKCNTCGYEWDVRPDNFINLCKVGCPKCAHKKSHDEARMSTEEIIRKGKELYGDRYSYNKVDSLNRDNKGRVCFTCNICGKDFWERPVLFLTPKRRKKWNCPNCIKISKDKNMQLAKERHENYIKNYVHNTESFIKKLNEKFPSFYDTSETVYVNNITRLILLHNGRKIITTPAAILAAKKPILHDRVYNTETFIKKAKEVHRDRYKYFHTDYKSAKENVLITCPIHGDFLQLPNNHLNGSGCPYCKNSKLEYEMKTILIECGFEFVEKQHFKWLGRQHLDFYLPKYSIAIECQGEQHFKDVVIYDSKMNNIERDFIKKNKCSNNNIKILYYFPKNTLIKDLLNEEFKHIYSNKNAFKSKEKILEFLKTVQCSPVDSSEFKA